MGRIKQTSIEELNRSLDAEYVLSFLGASRIQHCGPELRAYCRVHGSDRQRSLAVKLDGNLCMCHNTGCPAHEGGNLLWLHSLVHTCTIREAAEVWARKIGFGLEYEESNPQPAEFQFKEIGGISKDGRFWRNRLATTSQSPSVLQTSELDTFQSIFRFTLSDIEKLRRALRQEETYLYGPVYADFDNPFPGSNKPGHLKGTPFEEITSFEQGVHRAQIDAIQAVRFLFKNNILAEAIHVYFSGRGFHLEIDPRVCGIRPSKDLHHIDREFAYMMAGVQIDREKVAIELNAKGKPTKLAYPARLQTLDQNIYNSDRLWRVPNTLNTKSGLFKIPLSPDELRNSPAEQIIQLAKQPRSPSVYPEYVEAHPKARLLFINAWKRTQKPHNKEGTDPENQIEKSGYQIIRMNPSGKIVQGNLPREIVSSASKMARSSQSSLIVLIKK